MKKAAQRYHKTCATSPGSPPELIVKLADGGVHTLDDLADLAVDELTDLTGHTEEQARAIIMRAREHWFANEAASDV